MFVVDSAMLDANNARSRPTWPARAPECVRLETYNGVNSERIGVASVTLAKISSTARVQVEFSAATNEANNTINIVNLFIIVAM